MSKVKTNKKNLCNFNYLLVTLAWVADVCITCIYLTDGFMLHVSKRVCLVGGHGVDIIYLQDNKKKKLFLYVQRLQILDINSTY